MTSTRPTTGRPPGAPPLRRAAPVRGDGRLGRPRPPSRRSRLLLAEQCYHHAWHAELWAERFPQGYGHDLAAATAAGGGRARRLARRAGRAGGHRRAPGRALPGGAAPPGRRPTGAGGRRQIRSPTGRCYGGWSFVSADETADWQRGERLLQHLLVSPDSVDAGRRRSGPHRGGGRRVGRGARRPPRLLGRAPNGDQRGAHLRVGPLDRIGIVGNAQPSPERGCTLPKERVERDEEDLVRLYLTDIGQYPLLTKDDEVRLAQAIEGGNESRLSLEAPGPTSPRPASVSCARAIRCGEDAERTFVQSNLRLVVSIAKKYQASGLPLLDLIQEGNLGLMHAVEKFDWRKGFKFSTYATWWIRQAITRGIANTGRTIRLPVHAGDTLARLQKARARLELKLGRPATLAELSAEVEMPEDKVTEALRFAAEPLSLSEPLREDGDAELGDVVEDRSAESPFEVAATALLPEEISRLLAPLDEREREILKLRFGLDRGEPRTLEEVGEHFNLTRERIRQIEARAMSKLRHPSSDTGARDLLAV